MNTQLHYLMVRQRQAELVDRAERGRRLWGGRRIDATVRDRGARNADAGAEADVAIMLRLADLADRTAIERLAGLDSASVPAPPVLIAEAGGEIRAAVSLRDGAMIADPFHRTVAAQQLLRARAAQLDADGEARWRQRLLGRGGAARRHRATNPSAAMGGNPAE